MNIRTAYTDQKEIKSAISELKTQLKDFNMKFLLYFASSNYNPQLISSEIKEAFPRVPIMGCTTAGEIISGKMLKNSIVAMAFSEAIIEDIAIEVVEKIQTENNVPEIFKRFEKHFDQSMQDLEMDKYIGIILVDGLSGAEERVMEKIGDLTNVFFIGGAAGDDLKFQQTNVFANGRSYTDAAVLALIKPATKFDIIKTQSFNVLPEKFIVTKANEAKREVIEFNNQPASLVYAAAVKKSINEIDKNFIHNPVGLMVGNEPYVRSPKQAKNGSIFFYCQIREGMEVNLLESSDIVTDTRKALQEKLIEMGSFSGVINFNCLFRTLELEQKGQTEEYGQLFADFPTIGFSTYGEEFIGHINQTATMLMFK